MKKNEKIQLLEKSVNIFREEAIKLAKSLDSCKEDVAKLSYQLKEANGEVNLWQESAKTMLW
jgi:hypothetical protein